jgi:hypothetical protein
MAMLPFPARLSNARAAARAVASGIFDNVDVVFMQEVFRTDVISDSAQLLQAAADRTGNMCQILVPHKGVRPGQITDSGLAAAAVAPWAIRFVGFEVFAVGGASFDGLAEKGIAVFETVSTPTLRFAVTHLQSTADKPAMRFAQFKQAIHVARRHDAHFLLGDMNVSDNTDAIEDMDVYARSIFGDTCRRLISTDGEPTCCKPLKTGSGTHPKRTMHTQIDHVWALHGTGVTRCPANVVINHNVTDGWSDHSALDFTVYL